MTKPVMIGLLGAGVVGGGVIRVLTENCREIAQKAGTQIMIKRVFVRDFELSREDLRGLNPTSDFSDVLEDPEISIVVELMGGVNPAFSCMRESLLAGKHVVTANKDVIAQHGQELFEAAEKGGAAFLFEASVGGGIPIIAAIKECLAANRFTEVMGIVNGTTNYMLTKMTEDGADYDTVLKEAQKKGYAEANPASDVEGLDSARKAAILASIAFNTRVVLSDVYVEGITGITPEDISYAKELGYVVKLLAIAREISDAGVSVRVHPVLLPKTHPLSNVNDVFNAIFVRGTPIGEAMFYGQGAGSLPTASAVVGDIISIARGIVAGSVREVGCTCFERKRISPIEETEAAYYARLLVDDRPGVLGAIAAAFGEADVSLASVIQTRKVKELAEIVVITHSVRHISIEKAKERLKGLSVVKKISNVIRVEPAEKP